jgi:hypothetical protein
MIETTTFALAEKENANGILLLQTFLLDILADLVADDLSIALTALSLCALSSCLVCWGCECKGEGVCRKHGGKALQVGTEKGLANTMSNIV